MGPFLKLLGFVFLILIIAGVCAFLYIRSRIRKFREDISKLMEENMEDLTPVEIHLVDDGQGSFSDIKRVSQLSDEFQKLGFVNSGFYSIKEMKDIYISAMINTEKSVYAAIYEHPAVGVFCDVVADYEDGTSLTVSSMPGGGKVDSMPGNRKIYKNGANALELYEAALSNIGDKPLSPVSSDSFREKFENAYKQETEWRLLRGGATEDEIRRVAGGMDGEIDEETVSSAKLVMKSKAAFQLSQVCRNRFISDNIITEGRWKARENLLVIIHENMNSDEALFELFSIDGFDPDQETENEMLEIIKNEPSKIAGFERAILIVSEKIKLTKLGEINKPLRAALWEVDEILDVQE
ncbi:MAG: hypothetical protein LWY06_19090 [Firmicutes bacterium]|nr:hypothetical protein [Bacillota bacterium]